MLSGIQLSKVALAVCVVSLVLQVLGIACPGWLVVSINLEVLGKHIGASMTGFGEVVSEVAVWYVRVCIHGDGYTSCSSVQHDARDMGLKISSSLSDLANLDWLEVEIELSLALWFCILGCALVASSLFTRKISPKLMTALATPCMFVSGVLVLPAVFKVGLSIQDTKTAIALLLGGSELMDVLMPWALALTAAGLVLALTASVILLVAACKHEHTVEITPEQTRLPDAILKLGNFPLNVARISASDIGGHIPPHLPPEAKVGTSGFPAIGTHDEEPFQFGSVGLTREDTFDRYINLPHVLSNGGHPFLLEETITEVSTPPSLERMPTSLQEDERKNEERGELNHVYKKVNSNDKNLKHGVRKGNTNPKQTSNSVKRSLHVHDHFSNKRHTAKKGGTHNSKKQVSSTDSETKCTQLELV